MSDQPIQYAAAPGLHATHSRRALVAFGCACAAACGITVTMFLISKPLGGPVGGMIRGAAPIFGLAVLALWFGGLVLGISALRQRHRLHTFAHAALAMCGLTVLIFGMMLLLQY
jgi:hypothetical protein